MGKNLKRLLLCLLLLYLFWKYLYFKNIITNYFKKIVIEFFTICNKWFYNKF